jgi:predicted metal-dependent peptidase
MDGLTEMDGGGGLHPTWKEFNGMSEAEAKLAKAQIEHQIKDIVNSQNNKGRGFIPDELQSWIDNMFEESEPAYDWKSYFRRFCGTSSKTYTKKTT